MDNIMMENNQLKQVPATASIANDDADADDDHISHTASTVKRESTTDIDVSELVIIIIITIIYWC